MEKIKILAYCCCIAALLSSCKDDRFVTTTSSATVNGDEVLSHIKPFRKENVTGPPEAIDNHAPFTPTELGHVQFYLHGAVELHRTDTTNNPRKIINGGVYYYDDKFMADHSFYNGMPVNIKSTDEDGYVFILYTDSLDPQAQVRYRLQDDGLWHFAPMQDMIYFNSEWYEYSKDSKDSYLLFFEGGKVKPDSRSTQSTGVLIPGAPMIVDPPAVVSNTTQQDQSDQKKSDKTSNQKNGSMPKDFGGKTEYDRQGNIIKHDTNPPADNTQSTKKNGNTSQPAKPAWMKH